MNQIQFRLGLRPRPRWFECLITASASPRPPSWIWGPLRGRGGGAGLGKRRERGGEGEDTREVEVRETEGPQITVEPRGPSEPCYATAYFPVTEVSKCSSRPKAGFTNQKKSQNYELKEHLQHSL